MGQDSRISKEALKKMTAADVETLLGEVEAAMNSAPDGAIIAGSEEAVREAMARFRQRLYEKAVQLTADAEASAFSPCDRPQEP